MSHSSQPGQHSRVRGMKRRRAYQPPGTNLKVSTPSKGAQHRRERHVMLKSGG